MYLASTPWFEAYRETFLQMSYPSDHEFLRHYLACILCSCSLFVILYDAVMLEQWF